MDKVEKVYVNVDISISCLMEDDEAYNVANNSNDKIMRIRKNSRTTNTNST